MLRYILDVVQPDHDLDLDGVLVRVNAYLFYGKVFAKAISVHCPRWSSKSVGFILSVT